MIYVYYHYDACELGGHGMEMFDHYHEAEKFIVDRLKYKNRGEYPDLKDFTVIHGEELKIKIIQKIQEVKLS